MKVLGLIPARCGSKGIPNKNIKLLGGKELIAYSIDAAKESRYLNEIIVSTDCKKIFKVAEKYGCKPPFLRPDELAKDESKSLEVVKHAIQFFEEQNIFFDAICLIQPTSPFREKGFIDKAIQKFITAKTDSLISVLPIPHEFNPHWAFEENGIGLLHIATGEEKIISRRQDLPKTFYRDGSIYITKTNVIKEGSFFGETISYIEGNRDFYVNIDTKQDWLEAKKIVKKLK